MSEGMKKTGGRRRIPIQKIASKSSRNVTFSKRRNGLFSKANELATMCGSEIAVVVFSETGKPSAFGAESAIRRFMQESDSPTSLLPHATISTQSDPVPAQSAFVGTGEENADELSWKRFICSLGLNELKQYANFLQSLRDLIPTESASPPSSTYNGVTRDEGSLLMESGGCEQVLQTSPASLVGEIFLKFSGKMMSLMVCLLHSCKIRVDGLHWCNIRDRVIKTRVVD